MTGNGLVFTAEIGGSISFAAGCIMENVTDGFGSHCPVTFTFKNPAGTGATIYADSR